MTQFPYKVGSRVIYRPHFGPPEAGRITGYPTRRPGFPSYAFVLFDGDATAKATPVDHLELEYSE